MKLLLTSAGLTNESIANALKEMMAKDLNEVKIGFVPTAANVEPGNKDWYVRQLTDLYKHGFQWVDVVDISAPEVKWQDRLKDCDIILISGGNTFHLLDQIRKTGFADWFRATLDSKVFVGISAGSIIMTPSIAIASVDDGDENLINLEDLSGLSLVPFEVSVHTPENVSHEGNKKYLETIGNELYGLDNNSAMKVVDGEMEIVSEGEWIKY